MVAAPASRGPRVQQVMAALDHVMDPEMPGVSIVALGMVHTVAVDRERVRITLLPPFVGCPALDVMRARAVSAVSQATGLEPDEIVVEYSAAVPWTSDRVAPSCHRALRSRGIAPPPRVTEEVMTEMPPVACPWCGSVDTEAEGVFGPTACRSIYYCRACRNPFEAMKPV